MHNCLVQPVFNYTDKVWGGKPIGCINSMQHLQNRAAHIIQRRATAEEAFTMLVWVNLKTQRKADKHILVFECLNDLVPPYFLDYFITNSTCHTYSPTERQINAR